MPDVQKCDNCKFWKWQSANIGLCHIFMPEKGEFLPGTKTAPFWAQRIVRFTISWEGKDCNTWKRGAKR